MRRGLASTAPSRTTPTPILLALPSKPSTAGMDPLRGEETPSASSPQRKSETSRAGPQTPECRVPQPRGAGEQPRITRPSGALGAPPRPAPVVMATQQGPPRLGLSSHLPEPMSRSVRSPVLSAPLSLLSHDPVKKVPVLSTFFHSLEFFAHARGIGVSIWHAMSNPSMEGRGPSAPRALRTTPRSAGRTNHAAGLRHVTTRVSHVGAQRALVFVLGSGGASVGT